MKNINVKLFILILFMTSCTTKPYQIPDKYKKYTVQTVGKNNSKKCIVKLDDKNRIKQSLNILIYKFR